jgi:pimeloyl-ACP methyl ester carboxylesterase
MTEGTARIESGRLWFERAGEGFPVVLIHPGLWDARIWDDQFEEFSRHHDIIRYDARGYGRSDFPDAPYSDLRDLRYLLGELDIRRCALVGCATGAQLAIDFALAYPDVVDAIVAISPGLTGYRWSDAGLQTLVDEVDRAVRDGDPARAIDVELAVWAPTSARLDPRVREIALENAHVLRMDDSLLEAPPSAVTRLGDIQAATLVVVGHGDLAEIHSIADLLVAQIPGASKRVLAEADQLVNVSKAERFNRLVLDFLSFRS